MADPVQETAAEVDVRHLREDVTHPASTAKTRGIETRSSKDLSNKDLSNRDSNGFANDLDGRRHAWEGRHAWEETLDEVFGLYASAGASVGSTISDSNRSGDGPNVLAKSSVIQAHIGQYRHRIRES